MYSFSNEDMTDESLELSLCFDGRIKEGFRTESVLQFLVQSFTRLSRVNRYGHDVDDIILTLRCLLDFFGEVMLVLGSLFG